jgi:flagellar motor switch protein FliN
MSPLLHELAKVLSTRFAGVMQSVVSPEAEALPFDGAVTPGWLVPCELTGPIAGTWYLAIASDDAARLASRVLMKDTASPDEIGEALKELTAQALSGIGLDAAFTGMGASVGKPATAPVTPGAAVGSFACRLDDATTLYFGCSFAGSAAPARPPSSAPAPGVAAAAAPAAEKTPDNLELILDIDMPLTVRFGEATVSIEALSKLGPGSLVELARQPDDPVDVLINGRLVARGEVVVVAGNYGVRVTQVVSADERIRTLNG